ncbi:dihydrolipoamide acetyltransferase family protein [Alteriqipengyuania lutimaris]|uniref:dihydrolipoamide acetyltransferase family protein n=1 Tax=Alteriqipengyuania lutimaris TaxID=1538146 RepID=UPI001CFEA61D|nr:dihydrolipoamide acetyltransferase family protein [Alteriqipengyuania lutimaris]
MTIEITMPALSPTMEEGTLARWLVKVGDSIAPGDVIAEIETDKATMELEAADGGVIASLVTAEGTEEVRVGSVIAILADDAQDAADHGAAAAPPDAQAAHEVIELPARNRESASAPATPVAAGEVSLLAQLIAKRRGIDLSSIVGSGPDGRIILPDLDPLARPSILVSSSPTVAASPRRADAAHLPFDEAVPHDFEKATAMRKTIARRMTEAKQTIPHIYLTVDVRLDALLAMRAELNGSLEPDGGRLSVNDMLIRAYALALVRVPSCNASYAFDRIVKYARADISVAVSTPTGLITPIVRNADGLGLAEISATMKGLAERARSGQLRPEEYQGGTATLSNMGMHGIRQFDAVINPPQAMILAIGSARPQPRIVDGALAEESVISVTGSFDHRAIDGADAAAFLNAFQTIVENPWRLLV